MRTLPVWRWCMVGLVVVAGSGGARAGAAATLRWKLQPGETLHYVMEQKTNTAVKGGLQEVKSTISQTIDMDWTVKEVGADGQASMTQTITRVRTRIESAAGAFVFDSNEAKDPVGPIAGNLAPLLRALVGAEFAFKMSPEGELIDIKVPEKVLESLKKTGAVGGAAGMFSEEGMKNMVSESSLALPKEDLAKGKGWTRQTKIPMPPLGSMTLDKNYSYEGAETKDGKELDRIKLVTKVDIQLNPANDLEMKIQGQDGQGTIFFDNTRGRIVESSVSEKLEMIFKLKAAGQEQEMSQNNETSTTMKLVKAGAAEPSKK